jgi:anaerobic magnesium-protoporphyrin IX monomethyl ester cyclase
MRFERPELLLQESGRSELRGSPAPRKVVLIDPPDAASFTSNKDCNGGFGITMPKTRGPAYPPLDCLYAAACLERAGVPFRLIEPMGKDLTPEALALEGRELVGVRTSVPTLRHDLSFVRAVKARWPEITLILFGPSLQIDAARALQEPCVDGVLSSEPELAFLEMAFRKDWREVAGVTYREGGREHTAGPRSPIEDLDVLPFPNWSLLPYQQLGWDNELFPGTWFLTVLSSRGCPYTCHYCAYPLGQGNRMRFRSAKNVVDEIAQLRERYAARYVLFRDPLFTAKRGRILEICHEIRARGLKFHWQCETRPELVDERLLRAMADAGCVGINFGLETLTRETLEAVERKPCDRGRIADVTRSCRDVGIAPVFFLILGLPGETRESFGELVDFVCELRPHYAQLLLASPYPGTPLHDWAVERDFLRKPVEEVQFFGFEAFMRNEALSWQELERLREESCARLLRHCEATRSRARRVWRRLRQDVGRVGLALQSRRA